MQTLGVELSTEFVVLGFLGRGAHESFVYLARDLATRNLVALVVTSGGVDASGTPSLDLSVRESLDASVPDVEAPCPQCQSTLRPWARYCTQCGTDVSGISASSSPHSRATLLAAVRAEAGAELEVLGDMPRAEGGGLVYFARDRHTGRIVGMRLARQPDQSYDLKVTRVIKSTPSTNAATSERVSLVRRWNMDAQDATQASNGRVDDHQAPANSLRVATQQIDLRIVLGIVVVGAVVAIALLI